MADQFPAARRLSPPPLDFSKLPFRPPSAQKLDPKTFIELHSDISAASDVSQGTSSSINISTAHTSLGSADEAKLKASMKANGNTKLTEPARYRKMSQLPEILSSPEVLTFIHAYQPPNKGYKLASDHQESYDFAMRLLNEADRTDSCKQKERLANRISYASHDFVLSTGSACGVVTKEVMERYICKGLVHENDQIKAELMSDSSAPESNIKKPSPSAEAKPKHAKYAHCIRSFPSKILVGLKRKSKMATSKVEEAACKKQQAEPQVGGMDAAGSTRASDESVSRAMRKGFCKSSLASIMKKLSGCLYHDVRKEI